MRDFLRSIERQAISLMRSRPGSVEAERAAVRFEQNRHAFRDPELAAAFDIAKRYEDRAGEKIKAYAGGWPQLVNWQTCGQGTSQASFTTLQAIGLTQQPNIAPNTVNVGTMFHFVGFGIVGSAAGTATTTFGVDINGTGTAIMISASQTPATSTVNEWHFDGKSIGVSVGASGTVQSSGLVIGLGATASTPVLVPATQAAAATFNTQNANFFNLVASWSASAAGNLYQVNGFAVLQYN
jgi:hypothetical protein